MVKQCNNCFYHDCCDVAGVCDDYTSLDLLFDDDEVEKIIEDRRTAFYTEWFAYIDENAD